MFWLPGGGGRVGSSASFLLQSIVLLLCVLYFSGELLLLLLLRQFSNFWRFLKVSVNIFSDCSQWFVRGGLCSLLFLEGSVR